MSDSQPPSKELTNEQIEVLHQELLRIRMEYESLRIGRDRANQDRRAAIRRWYASLQPSHEPPPECQHDFMTTVACRLCFGWPNNDGTVSMPPASAQPPFPDATIPALTALLREARPYIESFAVLTKNPTAGDGAMVLAARIRARTTGPTQAVK